MTNITKKLTAALLALIAAVCLAFGVLLAVPRAASAADASEKILPAQYLAIDAGVLTGLNDDGTLDAYMNGKTGLSLNIPNTVNKITVPTISGNTYGILGKYSDKFVSITIPANVTEIGANAFRNCVNVTKINYLATNVSSSPTSTPFENIGNAEVIIGSSTLPVASIPSYLFKGTNIRSAQLYVSCGEGGLGNSIFADCKKLVSATFEEGSGVTKNTVVKLSNEMFAGCGSLAYVKLPNELKTIDTNVFNNCSNLKEIDIPSTVNKIEANAFYGCTGLVEVRNSSGIDFNATTGLNVRHVYKPSESDNESWFFNVGDFKFYKQTTTSAQETLTSYYLVRYDGANTDITLPENVKGTGYTVKKGAFRNTAITSVVIPEKVYTVEEEVFFECASLKSVTIKDQSSNSISTIDGSVFQGCTSLESITIPASVGEIDSNAFNGCTSLETVNFSVDSKNSSNLKRILYQAFAGCTALTEIRLPYSVTSISSNAFINCVNLEKVYLPTDTEILSAAFDRCSAELVLIAPNYTSYNKYIKYAYNLAYEVSYELYYGEAKAEEIVTQLNTDDLPAWEGYAKSVWYEDSAYSGNPITKTTLPATDDVIKLYAKKLNKPTANTFKIKDVDYDSGITLNDLNTILDSWVDTADYKLADYKFVVTLYVDMVSERYPYTIEEAKNINIDDAGSYELSVLINNEGEYGQWDTFTTVTLKVLPKYIEDLGILEWNAGAGALGPAEEPKTVLYVVGDKVYQEETKDAEKVEVLKSIANYTGKEIEISFAGASDDRVKVKSISGNKGTVPGKYTATVTLTLDNNYRLHEGSNIESLAGLGITISRDTITNVYTIIKDWYIIAENTNKLIFEKGAVYTINGWTYNANGLVNNASSVTLPLLQYGDINKIVTYSLSGSEAEGDEPFVTVEFTQNDFAKVINGTMPAGYYVLSVSIKNCEATIEGKTETIVGTGITNNADKPITVAFTVLKGSLSSLITSGSTLPDNGVDIYADYDGSNPVPQLGNLKAVIPVCNVVKIHPDRGLEKDNEWAKSKYDEYYKGFELTYSRTAGSVYRAEDDEEFTNIPREIGDYTIYYHISTFSYDDSVNTGNLYYELHIRGVIEPEVRLVPYAGKGVRVTVPDTDYYEVIYLDDKDARSAQLRQALGITNPLKYDEVGNRQIVLKIKDRYANTARWKDAGTSLLAGSNYGEAYYAFSLGIIKANNVGTQTPTMTSWEWGTYDPEVNVPHWATTFDGDGDITYNFILRLKSNPTEDNEYYLNPTDEQKGFDAAPAGEYFLVPEAIGTANVNGYIATTSERFGTVTVIKARITWVADETPFINSWKYGDDPEELAPAGTLNNSFETLANTWEVKIVRQADYDSFVAGETVASYATLKDLQAASNGITPAGTYVYVYHLDETADFEEWYHPVYFSVLQATNYWDIAPVINNWAYGDYSSLGNFYKPHFGDVKSVDVKIRNVADGSAVAMTPVRDLLDENGQLPMGKYEYRVELLGTTNYSRLVFENVTFEVLKAENSWTVIPQIIGWSEGRFNSKVEEGKVNNRPLVEARFGSVYLTVISDSTGETVIERVLASSINYGELNKLGVGSYTLLAEVDETANYTKLSSEAHFAVFEDSVGLTGLIASTMVFAVIAVGLAVAGVVLLILRNRKVEQEFRKMVNKELRRK